MDDEPNVFDIRTGEPIHVNAAEESPAVEEFTDTYVHALLDQVRVLADTFDPDEFWSAVEAIREQVSNWPPVD